MSNWSFFIKLLFLFVVTSLIACSGRNNKTSDLNSAEFSDSLYQTLIAKGGLFHLQENPDSAIACYEKAFQLKQPDAATAYQVAGMYALDSNREKAFQFLQMAIATGWTEADWLAADPYFNYLRTTSPERWKVIEKLAFSKEALYAQTLQLPCLRKEIDSMTLHDQMLRYQRVQNKNDSLSKEMNRQINQSDLHNLTRAKEIIHQVGWPTISQIGRDGQNNLWIIVQHADQDVWFQRDALQAMEKWKGSPELSMENYAFLYDRVQCNLNFKQLYGTQVVWTTNGQASAFRPMISEYLADERRKKIGLQYLQIYALTYGFHYQPLTAEQSNRKDSLFHQQVQLDLDSAKYYYTKHAFEKVYDFYNIASTFPGGMRTEDNFEAAVVLSNIAAVDRNDRYKSIALDFLELLWLQGNLSKEQLYSQPAFKILYREPRWKKISL